MPQSVDSCSEQAKCPGKTTGTPTSDATPKNSTTPPDAPREHVLRALNDSMKDHHTLYEALSK